MTWLAVVFGLRMLMQARRTGDTGLRHRRNSRVELVAQLLLGVSVLAVGILAPIAGMAGLAPVLDGTGFVGIVLVVAGTAVTLAGQLGMGESWRIGVDPNERTALVTGGLFGLARNPVFSAAVVTSVGIALMVGNVVALAGVVCLLIALELQVRRVEEPYLRRVHGAEYASYAARVGRFVPGIGRVRA
ncbi:isoprenylcysteine carboxylmethyltransferase family protein [Actinophytocola sp.]|uniref:methyltransferase family protein n=1 Tax=Actinophytocola sp. TaxID=1872138 RepID=UPI002ED2371D